MDRHESAARTDTIRRQVDANLPTALAPVLSLLRPSFIGRGRIADGRRDHEVPVNERGILELRAGVGSLKEDPIAVVRRRISQRCQAWPSRPDGSPVESNSSPAAPENVLL